MNMTKLTIAGAALATMAALTVGSATASTLDFGTTPYASTFGPNVTTDSVDGVNFVITATARGADGFRQSAGNGLNFGVPGNGMYTLAITADQDLTFNSMYGHGHSFPVQADQLSFNIEVDGASQSVGNMFASTTLETVSFASGPIAVSSGQSFFFEIDYSVFIGSSIYASALIGSFDFTVASTTPPSPVPLPAGFPLLMVGLGAFGFLRKKRK